MNHMKPQVDGPDYVLVARLFKLLVQLELVLAPVPLQMCSTFSCGLGSAMIHQTG